MARFEPIWNDAELGFVPVKILVISVRKMLENQNSVLGGLISGPPKLACLGGSGGVWAPPGPPYWGPRVQLRYRPNVW